MVPEVVGQLIVAFRFQPRKQCIQRGAQPQVRDCAEVFGRVEFFLEWIFLPFVGRSIRLDGLSGDPHVHIKGENTHLCVGRSDDIELLDLQFVILLFAWRGTLPCSDQCNQRPSTQSMARLSPACPVTPHERRLTLLLDEAQAGPATSEMWNHRQSPQTSAVSGFGWSVPYRSHA